MLELKPSGIQQFYSQKFNKIIITEINTKKKDKKRQSIREKGGILRHKP